jgi:hypothetical protein
LPLFSCLAVQRRRPDPDFEEYRTFDFGKLSGPAKPLNGSIAPKTGLLKVTFGSGASKTTGYGVILLNGTNGGGYFLTKTNAGAVILEP